MRTFDLLTVIHSQLSTRKSLQCLSSTKMSSFESKVYFSGIHLATAALYGDAKFLANHTWIKDEFELIGTD